MRPESESASRFRFGRRLICLSQLCSAIHIVFGACTAVQQKAESVDRPATLQLLQVRAL